MVQEELKMSGKRYREEFKKDAVQQVVERGYSVPEVAERLGVTTHSFYTWVRRYGPSNLASNQAALKRGGHSSPAAFSHFIRSSSTAG